ncbi:hypothetical protein VSH64_07355 [Amycolatopsis rhabdoformis]|uniref:Uncharacterized protein n=1 Tax=Amycolatopsis rhabdoformis TaxID=1448059 RepID=A0ABZ1IBX5_9PSEU|nr:hypothetical protein [Amycolatopsis rhabdoformis]WSE31925.1 hypothetical protein VSH64_07355 [Amycolatopsis rhabdoformis]
MEAIEVSHGDDWLRRTLESSPPTVRRAVGSFSRWHLLHPDGARVTDLSRSCGRTADFPAAAAHLRAGAAFSTVLVEDRLSRAGDPDVYPADAVRAVPVEPVSLDLGESVFTLASSGHALARILQGMSHWQFPVLLMLQGTPTPASLRQAIADGHLPDVAAAAISCCDGETVLVSR